MHRFGLEGAPSESAFDSPASRVATASGRLSLSKTRVAALAAAFFLLASWALACVAWGQAAAYDQLPASAALTADKKQQNELKGTVARILAGAEPLEPNKAKFEGWYRAFVFPQMTHPDKLAQLAETREFLLKNELIAAKSEEARQLLVRIALEEMKKIAAGNYHPGSRYNAMLIIGELNQTEAVTSPATSARPPRPLPAALQTIMEEWKKPNVSDAMTVACLIGARRHVDLDRMLPADQKMDPAVKKEIYDRSLALLQSKAPETRKPLAHAYLQAIATDILAYVGNPGENGETVAALDAVIDDPTSPDFLKAAAISAIGEMNLPQSYADQAPTLMRSFAEASFGFLLHEIEALTAEKQYRIDFATRPIQGGAGSSGYGADMMSGYPSSSDMMGSEYGSGYPGSGMVDPTKPPKAPRGPLADERDYVLENSKRRLMAYLIETQRALRGRNVQTPAGLAKLVTKPEEQEILKTIDDELDEVVDSMQDPELTIVQLIDALTARSAAMQTSLGVVPPAPPTEAADATAAGEPAATGPDAAAATGPAATRPAGGGPRGAGGRGPGARGAGGPAAGGPGAGGGRGPGARGPGAGGPRPAGTGPAGAADPAAGEAPATDAPAEEAPATDTPAAESTEPAPAP